MFGFLKRRRERESAIPGGSSESVTRQLKGDGEPIGQPVGQAFPQAGAGFQFNSATDLAGLMGMVGQAMQSGNFQVTQGENQVIDLRGSGLRDQILGAMQQHGLDPEAMDGSQFDASQMPALQAEIMSALQQAGVEVGQMGGAAGDATPGGEITPGDGEDAPGGASD